MNSRLLLESAGFSLLMVLPFIAPLLVPGGTALLHHRLALQKPLGGILLDIGFFFLIGIGTCLFVQRMPKFPRSMVAGFLSGFVLWWAAFAMVNVLISLPSFTGETQFGHLVRASQMRLLEVNSFLPMLFAGIAVIKAGLISSLVRKTRFGLAAFSFSAMWMVPQIAFMTFYLHARGDFDHSKQAENSCHHRRIVWILFDELSFKLAFESTPNNLRLPNFHNLALQSSSFGNVEPPAYYTDRIVSAVLSGKKIDNIKSSSSGKLLYRENSNGPWLAYDPDSSLFGEAKRGGWNPGLAGWYNPYCRIFVNVLTTCSWEPGSPSMMPFDRIGALPKKSALENALLIPRFFLNLFSGIGGPQLVEDQDQNSRDYQTLIGESQKLIQNGKLHVVFLHLPMPHPPGFYDRNRHAFCRCGNYLDNLVLADDTLGMLRQEIEQSPLAPETTLIVSSDHSWRVHMWSSGFTPEEYGISGGIYEPRPVFLIHFPGQTSPQQFTESFAELHEYDVIFSMLAGKINKPEDLNLIVRQIQSEAQKR